MLRITGKKTALHSLVSPNSSSKQDGADREVGCSFTFEKALADAGLTPRHQEEGRNVPMYRTNLPLLPSGSKFFPGSTLVVEHS